MENSFSSIVNQANSVLILIAKNPYVDQVAAGLSLYLSLKNQGKNVMVAASSPMMVEHNRLVGIDKVTTEPGNKNLVIKFSGYQADNIERVSYDVDGQEFRLTVIPKPQFEPPVKDNIDLSYSGIAADIVILVGGMNISHFPLISTGQLVSSKIVHVGVQTLPSEGGIQVQSFAEGTASTSELVAKLIKDISATIDQDIASNLLMGMQEGTRNFSHSRVTAETFHLAGELMEKGASLDPRQSTDQKQYPPGAIPGQPVKSFAPVTPEAANPEANASQDKVDRNAPESWLQPKIYKGSSK